MREVAGFIKTIRLLVARAKGRKATGCIFQYLEHLFDQGKTIAYVRPDVGIDIIRIKDFPEKGLMTYATHGLSRYPLSSNECKCEIHHELTITVDGECQLPIETALIELSRLSLYLMRPILPGATVEYSFAEEFRDNTLTIAGFYASDKVWLPGEANTIPCSVKGKAYIVELVPITNDELPTIKGSLDEFIEKTLNGSIELLNHKR